jgi:hypothetical protein
MTMRVRINSSVDPFQRITLSNGTARNLSFHVEDETWNKFVLMTLTPDEVRQLIKAGRIFLGEIDENGRAL